MLISHDSNAAEDYSGHAETGFTLYNDRDPYDTESTDNITISNFDPTSSTFKEEDSEIFID